MSPSMYRRTYLVLAFVVWSAHAAASTLPPGFTESLIAGSLANPMSMAVAPDGRVFVCLQSGQVRVIKDGALLPAPFLSLTVHAVGEHGLLALAFDPAFADNQYVYVHYTATAPTPHNRVSRFIATGDVAVAGSETVLLELDSITTGLHDGGALHFGWDGTLYVTTGDNGVPARSQALDNLFGKVLRINRDGTIPSDNPFLAQTTGNRRAIWALGLRNPFTAAIHPSTGRLFINDVGTGRLRGDQ